MIIEAPLMWAIGTAVFTGGAAAGGVKVALNGTKERVKKLETKHDDQAERLARIEGKLDFLVNHSQDK